ncbi:MAG: hypothetical protein ABIQ18_20495 [Umezawaea sp.]
MPGSLVGDVTNPSPQPLLPSTSAQGAHLSLYTADPRAVTDREAADVRSRYRLKLPGLRAVTLPLSRPGDW